MTTHMENMEKTIIKNMKEQEEWIKRNYSRNFHYNVLIKMKVRIKGEVMTINGRSGRIYEDGKYGEDVAFQLMADKINSGIFQFDDKEEMTICVDGDNSNRDGSYIKTGDIIELDAFPYLNKSWICDRSFYRKVMARSCYPYPY